MLMINENCLSVMVDSDQYKADDKFRFGKNIVFVFLAEHVM